MVASCTAFSTNHAIYQAKRCIDCGTTTTALTRAMYAAARWSTTTSSSGRTYRSPFAGLMMTLAPFPSSVAISSNSEKLCTGITVTFVITTPQILELPKQHPPYEGNVRTIEQLSESCLGMRGDCDIQYPMSIGVDVARKSGFTLGRSHSLDRLAASGVPATSGQPVDRRRVGLVIGVRGGPGDDGSTPRSTNVESTRVIRGVRLVSCYDVSWG